jgi:hypothetical protein
MSTYQDIAKAFKSTTLSAGDSITLGVVSAVDIKTTGGTCTVSNTKDGLTSSFELSSGEEKSLSDCTGNLYPMTITAGSGATVRVIYWDED